MQKLTHSELETFILNKIKGVCFVSARTETIQSTLNKGSGANAMMETINVNPNNIIKHTDLVFAISGGNVTYQDLVKNRLIKEAIAEGRETETIEFDVKKHKWGKLLHDDCNALLTHKSKGGRYLIAYCVANNKPKVKHTYQGNPINLTEARFDAYQKPARKEGESQGTKKTVVIRDYKFDSVKEITMFGITYQVIPD